MYTNAAPPNKAAAPNAPVFIGIAAALLLLLDWPPPALVATAPVGVGTPLVNGTFDAEEAPEKAGIWVAIDGLGVAVVFIGLRTLSIT